MSESETDKENFKVVDKRRYHDDGELREGADSSSDEAEKPRDIAGELKASKKQPAPEPEKQPEQKPTAAPDAYESGAYESGTEEQKVDFSSFVVSLATQAMIMLGEIPNPETGQQVLNVEAARQTIDIVGLLQEKTKGNLNEQEENLLTEVLTSIRLAYVNKTQG